MVKVICRSFDELRDALEKFPVEVRAGAEEELDNITNHIVETAKIFCPLDTGALAESIRKERIGALKIAIKAGGGGVINPKSGREVDYAGYVHDGTSRMVGRPFLDEAIILEEPIAQKIVDATLRRIS